MDLPFSPSQLESLYALLSHIDKFYNYNYDSYFFDQVPGTQSLPLHKSELIDIEYIRDFLTEFIDQSAASPAPESKLNTCVILTPDQFNLLSEVINLVRNIHLLDSRSEFYIDTINKFLYNLTPKKIFLLNDLYFYFTKQRLPF